MLVESDPHQTRVAVLEDDRLTELLVERRRERGLAGNVYKGRVSRVLPGMQAAFVDIGLERDAFLYVNDIADDTELAQELAAAEPGDGVDGPEDEDQDEHALATPPERSIDELVKQGQELIVQVTKDPLPNKGARISSHVTLPGRYLVLLPTVRHLGVSRRIEEEEERERLHSLLETVTPPEQGLIARTLAEERGEAEFRSDLEYLSGLWRRIGERAARVSAPTLLHQDLDAALRLVRDQFSEEDSVLWVEGDEAYERIVHFLDQVQPRLASRVKLYEREQPLFQRFGIEEEIEAALRSRVWLKSGGYLVINPTEALVAIDVNTGRYVGGSDLEDTVHQTNLEAVVEIVRQIRLRDLGGIIVIDLIDMEEQEHRDTVLAALEQELEKDRAKSRMLGISEFGLVELTRKRTRPNLERVLTQPCPYCRGHGRIKSPATICLSIRQEILDLHREKSDKDLTRPPMEEILLRVNPEVARALQQEERAILEELQGTLGVEILVQSDRDLHRERFAVSEL